ncbi:MAG: HAD hydrolase family protein, partial [Bacteroidota bacterium]
MPRHPKRRSSLKRIRLLLLDVDGVMSDGGVYYTESGDELKKFNIQDGYGIVRLRDAGVAVGLITGRISTLVRRRAAELGITEVHQNLTDKRGTYEEIKARLGLADEEIAYMGDDEPDLPVLQAVGFSAAPANAVESVKRTVQYVCRRNGGEGAVREVIELILG